MQRLQLVLNLAILPGSRVYGAERKDCSSSFHCQRNPFSAFFSSVSRLIADDRPQPSAKVHYLLTYVHCSVHVSLGVSLYGERRCYHACSALRMHTSCTRSARCYFPFRAHHAPPPQDLSRLFPRYFFSRHFSRARRLRPALRARTRFHTPCHM